MTDIDVVDRFWQDAASIFETASAVADGSSSDMAILLDERNGLRIVDATAGWTLDALRREYRANTAYSIHRTGSAVVVEGQNAAGTCSFKKNLSSSALTNLHGNIPHHLVSPRLLA